MSITKIHAREIVDSRGNPTFEVEAWSGSKSAIAAAPSGASTGANEVPAFPKSGVSEAIKLFNSTYAEKFIELDADYHQTDALFKELDPGYEKLGGNMCVAISLAVGKLQAVEQDKDFYEIFGTTNAIPFPLGNVLGGGAHAGKGSPDFQEFLVLPIGAKNIQDAISANETVHKQVLELIYKKISDFTKGRNDEGGWAPKMNNEEALEILVKACDIVSSEIGFDVKPGMDIAATQFWDKEKEQYVCKGGESKPEKNILIIWKKSLTSTTFTILRMGLKKQILTLLQSLLSELGRSVWLLLMI